MIKYIHLGYPKNFSTSLQRDYFSGNPNLLHLGIGLSDNLKYYDDVVDKTFEVYLKTCKTQKYERSRSELIRHFQNLYESNLLKGYKAFGASSEHLSFSFTYDCLSADIKANRLADLFGTDTKIIMIIRNQLDLIKSLFRESIRVGFKGNFADYILYLYKYQDRNYVGDLFYNWVYETYANVFGSDNIHVLLFENYRGNGKVIVNSGNRIKLFNDLDLILEITTSKSDFGHYNESLNDGSIRAKIRLNMINSHDLGNHMYEVAEKHRLKGYLNSDLNLIESDQQTYCDVIKKRALVKTAIDQSLDLTESNLYECDMGILSILLKDYEEDNKKLEISINKNLPSRYYNMHQCI